MFSIKETVEEESKETEDSSQIDTSLPKDAFTAEDFKTFWSEFLLKLNKKKDKAAFNVLQTAIWRITTDSDIELTFDSSVMIFEFDKLRERFLKKVRKKLNNYSIQVHTKVSTSKKTKNHIKSRKEQFNDLVKINPNIEILRQKFGLDIDNEP